MDEVRDALAAGETTVVIPTGGTEQNGPHVVLGKHNYLVKYKAGEIAKQLGNALVAPVMAYVPEGDVDPPTGHMRYAGTITRHRMSLSKCSNMLREASSSTVSSTLHSSATAVAIRKVRGCVAAALNKEWAATSARVHHMTAYYPGPRRRLGSQPGGQRGGRGLACGDTRHASLMYINPSMLRIDKLTWENRGRSGAIGDPAKATAVFGKRILEMQIEDAAAQIRELRVSSRGAERPVLASPISMAPCSRRGIRARHRCRLYCRRSGRRLCRERRAPAVTPPSPAASNLACVRGGSDCRGEGVRGHARRRRTGNFVRPRIETSPTTAVTSRASWSFRRSTARSVWCGRTKTVAPLAATSTTCSFTPCRPLQAGRRRLLSRSRRHPPSVCWSGAPRRLSHSK